MFSAKDWDDFCENRYKTQRARYCGNIEIDFSCYEEYRGSCEKKASHSRYVEYDYKLNKEDKCSEQSK